MEESVLKECDVVRSKNDLNPLIPRGKMVSTKGKKLIKMLFQRAEGRLAHILLNRMED